MDTEKIILSNGYGLPNICYGSSIVQTYRYGNCSNSRKIKYWGTNLIHNQFKKDIALPEMLDIGMKNGITMFDTSRAYGGSEYSIGKTLSKYNRDSYQIVTKLSNSYQYSTNIREGFEKSLKELNVSYVDVYLMHWPVSELYIDSYKQLEQLYNEGLCKAIGVCNFNIHHLELLKNNCTIIPMINQIECHPLFTQNELRKYCKDNDIQVMAYTSTARMDERLRKTVLVPIAKKYNKTITQIILRWHQEIGNIPIVNTCNSHHMLDNTKIGDFILSEDEIDSINRININSRLRYDPDNCDFTQL